MRIPRARRRPPDDATGDVVLVMGTAGAGKSTLAVSLVAEGYARLNRDETGGGLGGLLPRWRRISPPGAAGSSSTTRICPGPAATR